MENQQSLPLFYQNPIPLHPETHGAYRIAPNPKGLAFAAKAQMVLLAGVEFFDACHQSPIIFSRHESGRIFPCALLGIEPEENLFVGAHGEWRGSYLPAYIRRYPFIHTISDGKLGVFIDAEFPGFQQETGELLFENAQPTEKLKEIGAFLQDYAQQIEKTESLCSLLAQLDLLKPMDVQVKLNDGRDYALRGMLVVDEKKLGELPDYDVLRIFRNGELALITAHLLSLRNINQLIKLKSMQ